MYCIECVADVIIEKEINRQVIEAHNSTLDYEFLKKSMGYYLLWVLLHLGLLLIGSGGIFNGNNMGANKFWPFGSYFNMGLRFYDITEFLVYTIFPLAMLVIWSMVRTQENINNPAPNE